MLRAWMCVLFLAAATASAQEWEVGAIGGLGVAHDLTVKNSIGSANAGFSNGYVIGVYGGEDMYRYWSGEASYLYRRSNLKLDGAGLSESFSAHTHLMTGDILAHFRPRESHIRPFVSFGGGLKVIEGTGDEGKLQPLGACSTTGGPLCFAALTHTTEVLAVGEVGAGVKVQLNKHFRLRIQVRDYISKRPEEVITTGPGASMSGLTNDIIGTGSIGFTW